VDASIAAIAGGKRLHGRLEIGRGEVGPQNVRERGALIASNIDCSKASRVGGAPLTSRTAAPSSASRAE
jgi:hypothetical protein